MPQHFMDFSGIGGVADFDPSPYGLGGPADIEQSFIGDPAGLWKTARSKALGQRAFQPQFQKNIMAGFDPAWGGYLLGGSTGGTFADYLRGGEGLPRPGQGGVNAWATPNLGIGSNWANVLAASRALNPNASQQVEGLEGLRRQQAYQGYINPAVAGEAAARQNALAIAGAAMGGGVGYGASMRQRALGNLYDIYSQRALGAGAPGGGFLGYLGGLTGTGAPATTGVATTPGATPTSAALIARDKAEMARSIAATGKAGATSTSADLIARDKAEMARSIAATGKAGATSTSADLIAQDKAEMARSIAATGKAGANVVSGGGMELLGPSLGVASTGPWNHGPDSLRYLQAQAGDTLVPGDQGGWQGIGATGLRDTRWRGVGAEAGDLSNFPGDFGLPPTAVPTIPGVVNGYDPYDDPMSRFPGDYRGPSFSPAPVTPIRQPIPGLDDLPMSGVSRTYPDFPNYLPGDAGMGAPITSPSTPPDLRDIMIPGPPALDQPHVSPIPLPMGGATEADLAKSRRFKALLDEIRSNTPNKGPVTDEEMEKIMAMTRPHQTGSSTRSPWNPYLNFRGL